MSQHTLLQRGTIQCSEAKLYCRWYDQYYSFYFKHQGLCGI